MTMPIVKHSFLVRSVDDLPRVMAEAFRLAREGRPGPVLVDLPKDVQVGAATHLPMHEPAVVEPVPAPPDAALAEAIAAIAAADKPVIYGGGGIGICDAADEFRQFVEATGVPTVLTLRGLGSLPGNHPLFLGMLGMHGTRAANIAVQECDLLVVVGARFDDRATGKLAEFAPFARVVHLDADAYEISKLRNADIALPGDLAAGLRALAAARRTATEWRKRRHTLREKHAARYDAPTLRNADSALPRNLPARPRALAAARSTATERRKRCNPLREKHAARYDAPGTAIYAPALLKRVSELSPDAIVTADVGQHQMWVAQHCRFSHPRHHLTSGALGTMGFGLPAAMGAQDAFPDRPAVLVSGDGGFMR